MKHTLLEFTAPEVTILSETVDEKTNDRTMRVSVKWQHAGVVNGNGRRYPKEVLSREMSRLQPLMAEGKIFGASYHPKGDAEVDDVSHLWESVTMEADGSCVGVVKVIPTDRGRNAMAIIKAGGRIGMSSRGYGSTTRKEEVVNGKTIAVDEINPDYNIKSPGDFVLTPSVPDAGTRHILESRFNETDDSNTGKGADDMKFATLDELRAANGELLKPLDDENSSLKEQVKNLGEKVVQLEAENKTLLEKVEGLQKEVEMFREAIREIIAAMGEIPGVIPEDDEEEDEEDKEAGDKKEGDEEEPAKKDGEEEPGKEGDDKAKEIIDLKTRAEAAEAKLAAIEEAKKADDTKAVELAEALKAKTKAAYDEALLKETEEYRPLIEKELVVEGVLQIATPEEVADKMTAARAKISSAIAEAKKEEIKKSGIDEKGHINPDVRQLNEEQVKARWQAALRAGYKGSLEQYSKDVLKISK